MGAAHGLPLDRFPGPHIHITHQPSTHTTHTTHITRTQCATQEVGRVVTLYGDGPDDAFALHIAITKKR